MHFEDLTRLFMPGLILWLLPSKDKVPKCVTILQLNNNQPAEFMCSKFFGPHLTDKCQLPWTSKGNQKVVFLFADFC